MHSSLLDDLKVLKARPGASTALNGLIERACFAAAPDMPALVAVSRAAHLSVFQALALLLKADWEEYDRVYSAQLAAHAQLVPHEFDGHANGAGSAAAHEPWQPWCDPARWGELLAGFEDAPAHGQLELLLLEQWALGCHQLPIDSIEPLAQRYRQASALLAAASAQVQAQFLHDKGEWLRQEFALAGLIDRRRELSEAMEQARWQFLMIVQDVYPDFVKAAHRLALWQYREHHGDLTFTPEEMQQRLTADLADQSGAAALDPELRQVLIDSLPQLQSDLAQLRSVAELAQAGLLSAPSREEVKHAELLFRKLARKIHPDALSQHEHYEAISAANKQTLAEIWQQASATYRRRAYLERQRLFNFITHLERWHARTDRILRNLSFHVPERLVEGETLAAQCHWIKQALIEVARYLHAVRDDLAQLALDPKHQEYLRVIEMSEQARLAERCRMAQQARAWNEAADEIQRALEQRAAQEAQAEAQLRKPRA